MMSRSCGRKWSQLPPLPICFLNPKILSICSVRSNNLFQQICMQWEYLLETDDSDILMLPFITLIEQFIINFAATQDHPATVVWIDNLVPNNFLELPLGQVFNTGNTVRVAQQCFRSCDDQRAPVLGPYLAADQVEQLSRRGWHAQRSYCRRHRVAGSAQYGHLSVQDPDLRSREARTWQFRMGDPI